MVCVSGDHVVVCLKSGEKPDISYVSANSEALQISQNYWEYVIRHLYEDGYLEGVSLMPVVGRGSPGIRMNEIMITPKGIDFLQNNSSMAKAKNFLKTLKEIVPGL